MRPGSFSGFSISAVNLARSSTASSSSPGGKAAVSSASRAFTKTALISSSIAAPCSACLYEVTSRALKRAPSRPPS